MSQTAQGKTPLLETKHLKKYFDVKNNRKLHAVDDVSFSIMPGETLGLVGESGCGKSTVGNVLIRLLSATDGEVLFKGQNIFKCSTAQSNELRKKMQIIFQDPYSSLNPKKTIKSILSEAYTIHGMAQGAELDAKINKLIDMAGLEPYILERYPHELDGGRRQLIGIARALSLNPEFIVCDEPVSSLDVSIQATIINLLVDLQKELGISYLFISHDLSVVRHISHKIAVMYLGQVVEMAETDELFGNTLHPYSIALLSAVPHVELGDRTQRIVLKGDVSSPIDPGPGCRFQKRCWMAQDICATQMPELKDMGGGHCVACHFCHQSRENLQKWLANAAKTQEETNREEAQV